MSDHMSDTTSGQTTLKCTDTAGREAGATGSEENTTKPGRVFKISMEGIPVVTKEMWAEIVERARQPSKKFRPYPIL